MIIFRYTAQVLCLQLPFWKIGGRPSPANTVGGIPIIVHNHPPCLSKIFGMGVS
jgi:hypothetical protein